jgi:hypothetical protein
VAEFNSVKKKLQDKIRSMMKDGELSEHAAMELFGLLDVKSPASDDCSSVFHVVQSSTQLEAVKDSVSENGGPKSILKSTFTKIKDVTLQSLRSASH